MTPDDDLDFVRGMWRVICNLEDTAQRGRDIDAIDLAKQARAVATDLVATIHSRDVQAERARESINRQLAELRNLLRRLHE